jgi:methylated-DNA-[protein]-cysteine S-methyltransferase
MNAYMNSLFFDSPLGGLEITEEDGRITGLSFSDKPASENGSGTPVLSEAVRQLDEYFAGKRKAFDLPLALLGTDFQKKVWAALIAIPYGETRSYGEIAALCGNPKAARAVGMANNKNPVAIIVPCHRVIGFNGDPVGYGGGLDKKLFLLELEKKAK